MQNLQSLEFESLCPCQRIVNKLLLYQISYQKFRAAHLRQRLKKPEQVIHGKGYYRPGVEYYRFHGKRLLANFILDFRSMPAECSFNLVLPRYFIMSHWEMPMTSEAWAVDNPISQSLHPFLTW